MIPIPNLLAEIFRASRNGPPSLAPYSAKSLSHAYCGSPSPICRCLKVPTQGFPPLLKVKLLVGPTCKSHDQLKGAKGIRRSPKMCFQPTQATNIDCNVKISNQGRTGLESGGRREMRGVHRPSNFTIIPHLSGEGC